MIYIFTTQSGVRSSFIRTRQTHHH